PGCPGARRLQLVRLRRHRRAAAVALVVLLGAVRRVVHAVVRVRARVRAAVDEVLGRAGVVLAALGRVIAILPGDAGHARAEVLARAVAGGEVRAVLGLPLLVLRGRLLVRECPAGQAGQ